MLEPDGLVRSNPWRCCAPRSRSDRIRGHGEVDATEHRSGQHQQRSDHEASEHIAPLDADGAGDETASQRIADRSDQTATALAEIEARAAGQILRKPGGRPKVLIVDDDLLIHRLIERVIGETADVLTALDCATALEVLDRERPDLILLDVHLPDMKGTDFLLELKGDKCWAGIPVVMLSNSYDDSTVVSGLGGGAIDYLSKDIKIPDLRPRLLGVLEHGRARLTGSA